MVLDCIIVVSSITYHCSVELCVSKHPFILICFICFFFLLRCINSVAMNPKGMSVKISHLLVSLYHDIEVQGQNFKNVTVLSGT